VPAPVAVAAGVGAEVDAAVAPVGGAPVDAAAGAAEAARGGVVNTVAVVTAAAAASAAGSPPPPPSLGQWHGTAGGWRGCLPTLVRADAVALAVGVLGRFGREDGLLSLEEWGVVGRP